MGKKEFSIEKMQRACRMRQVRENAGLTQEKFAELVGLTLDGYSKSERGENNISLEVLEKLHEKMNISADFILYGKPQSREEVWKGLLNCTESDKLFLLLRLMGYFTEAKAGRYVLEEEQKQYDQVILETIRKLQETEEK